MKVHVVVNPRAGLAAHRALAALEQARQRPFWSGAQLSLTERPGHATALARAAVADAADMVVAVGGDGTVNEVAAGLLGTPITLGLVPVGSGNGLARSLRIPLRPELALRSLEAATPLAMDVGLANGRPFLNVAGAGMDADVGAAFQARGEHGARRGLLPYVLLAARHALQYRPRRWTLELDGRRETFAGLIVVFANGRQYGGGAVVAPAARLDDGRLDLVVIGDASVASRLVSWPRLFLGTIARYRHYRWLPATHAVLTEETRFRHHRDGEPMPEVERLEVSVERGALRILVPQDAAQDPAGPFSPGRNDTPGGR